MERMEAGVWVGMKKIGIQKIFEILVWMLGSLICYITYIQNNIPSVSNIM